MNLRRLYLTENPCYKAGRTILPKGIMVHSTGANNPTLKRYVNPDDGLLGQNLYNNHWNQAGTRQVCVHAFIGKLENGTIATYQTLPWNLRGWHCGRGAKGSGNDTHISFEICEDGLTNADYFRRVYREAVELCACLCRVFNLNPLADGVLIGHYEGWQRGIASNHSDPRNWFPRFGKSMDSFRADVAALLHSGQSNMPDLQVPASHPEPVKQPDPAKESVPQGKPTATKRYRVQVGSFANKDHAQKLLKTLREAGFTDAYIKTE